MSQMSIRPRWLTRAKTSKFRCIFLNGYQLPGNDEDDAYADGESLA
jgi:hypothetical protein